MELTKFELARIIGARALQLANGAPPLIEVKEGATAVSIAMEELELGVIPLVVLR
jgi:DNA-directed RNA polymerase subunit K/omega